MPPTAVSDRGEPELAGHGNGPAADLHVQRGDASSARSEGRTMVRRTLILLGIPLYVVLAVLYVTGSFELSDDVSAGDHSLPVSGAEMTFDSPLQIEPGWTTISFRNQGGLAHQASLYRLHEGVRGEDLASALRDDPLAWQGEADPVGGVGGIPAGSTQDVALELTPGEYLITCFLRGGSAAGDSHVQFGMSRVLQVRSAGDADEGSPPEAGGEFVLRDGAFEFPDGFSGSGVFVVRNDGTQPHELSILRLGEGKTVDDFTDFMRTAAAAEEGGPRPSGPPPFTNAGGFTIVDPGMSGVMVVDLEPGSYVASDFIPDPDTGEPHFLGGMLQPFDVSI